MRLLLRLQLLDVVDAPVTRDAPQLLDVREAPLSPVRAEELRRVRKAAQPLEQPVHVGRRALSLDSLRRWRWREARADRKGERARALLLRRRVLHGGPGEA